MKPLKLEIVEYNETRITDKKAAGRWVTVHIPSHTEQSTVVCSDELRRAYSPITGFSPEQLVPLDWGEGQRPRGTREAPNARLEQVPRRGEESVLLTTRSTPRREVLASVSLAPKPLLFHIILE